MQKTRTKHIDFFTKRVYNRFRKRYVENPRIGAKNPDAHIAKSKYYPSVFNCRKEKKPGRAADTYSGRKDRLCKMKRTAICSVLFFAMFMVLAGILCMGVAAEDTADGQITLVNPFNPSQKRTLTPDAKTDVYKLVIDETLEFEKMPLTGVNDFSGCVYDDKTVLYVVRDLKMNDQMTLINENVWIIGVNKDITITSTTGSPFIISSGSTTISSLTIDGSDFSGDATGIRVDGGGALTLKDVTIKNCSNSGVQSSGIVNVSGQVNITGNTAGGKESNLRSASPVNVIDKLTGNIGIDMSDNTTGIAATGDIDTVSVDVFSLDNNSKLKPTLNDKNELIFTESGSTNPDPGQSDQKTSSVGIKVNGSIDAENNKVTFTITTNVPQCIGDYIPAGTVSEPQISTQSSPSENQRGTYMLVFHNTLDSKLNINKNSLKLTVSSKEVTDGLYTVKYDNLTDGCTFELSVNLVELYNKGYYTLEDVTTTPPDVVLTFDATPKEGKLSGQYIDTAYINYGPYNEISKLDKTVDGKTTVGLYTVTVFKYDQENQAKGLAGATFILNKVEGEIKTQISTGTTNDNGYCFFSELEPGNYELVESKAPDGYAKSDSVYKFTCDRDVTVNFANVKLPHTGGIGYKLPVTIGIICVIGGGVLIAFGRKKKNDK